MGVEEESVIELELKKLKSFDYDTWLQALNKEYYRKLEEKHGIRFEE